MSKSPPPDNPIPDAIKAHIKQHNLSEQEMARALGLGIRHYREVISGSRKLPFLATKRAYALGIPAEILLQL